MCLPGKLSSPCLARGPGRLAPRQAGRAVAGVGSPPVHVAGRPAYEHGHYFGPCGPSPRPHHSHLVPGAAATWRRRCRRDFPLLPGPFRSRRANPPGSLPRGGMGLPTIFTSSFLFHQDTYLPRRPPRPPPRRAPSPLQLSVERRATTVPRGQLKLGPYARPLSRQAAPSRQEKALDQTGRGAKESRLTPRVPRCAPCSMGTNAFRKILSNKAAGLLDHARVGGPLGALAPCPPRPPPRM